MRTIGLGLTSGVVGAMLLTLEAGAKTPQEQVLDLFEQGRTPSTATLIDCIQDAYHGLAKGTFRNDVNFVVIARMLGRPDVTTRGSAVILQRGTDFRFEALPNVTSSYPPLGDIPAFSGKTERKFVFVRNGDELLSLQEDVQIAEGEFVSQAFKIDLSGFNPEIQARVTGPFASLLEFDLLEAGSELSVQREIYQGRPVLTLSTEEKAAISFDDAVQFATFFVQPETCLVLRMEQHVENLDFNQFQEFQADMAYTTGVRVPSSTFRIRFPPDVVVEDLTNDPEIVAAIEDQEVFDDEVLGPLD